MQRRRLPAFPSPYKTYGVPASRPFPPCWQSIPVVPVTSPLEARDTTPDFKPEHVVPPPPPPSDPPCNGGLSGSSAEGLLHYQKHWYLCDADIKVGNELLSGTPIGIKENTLCLINKEHRYFIPLRKVDYIRTPEGLESSFEDDCGQ